MPTLILFWNNFLGFHGPPVTEASFEAVIFPRGKTPEFVPLTARARGDDRNIFDIERQSAFGTVRFTGSHPETRERRTGEVGINNGETKTVVV